MSGGRARNFRLGDRSELLVEHLLAGLAFTTRVPRQEDIGIDFMCSLITGSHGAGLLKAGPFFSVQSKSNRKALVYQKPHEKGLAIYSAPSFALGIARCTTKRKQGNRWGGY